MLKMKELMLLTNESKSTILYYVKEGLLPQPDKPKPNLHLYSENSIKILKFIKYLQNNFSYSILQIKEIFKNNQFEFDDSFEMMVKSLELISGGTSNIIYKKEDFLKLTTLKESELQEYIDNGYILKNDNFNKKDLEIIQIIIRTKKLNLNYILLDEYVKLAGTIAKIENDIGSEFLSDDNNSDDIKYELLFDIILKLKPYIFNSYTVQEHKNKIKKEK